MSILITESGASRVIHPANERDYTLNELQSLLGCDMIEIVRAGSYIAVIDEEGKLRDRKINLVATAFLKPYLQPFDVIVGPTLLCLQSEIQ
jgi:hypothetical protein